MSIRPTPLVREQAKHHGSRVIAALMIVGAIACEEPSAPTDASNLASDMPVTATKGLDPALGAFLAVQGTYCDAGPALPCNPLFPGLGYVTATSETDDGPVFVIDPWGANARWYAVHYGPVFPAYSFTGRITEQRRPDGRRHLTVNLRAENTFAAVNVNWTDSEALVGAHAPEYGSQLPALATASTVAEFLLPADYVGYPDLTQLAFQPNPGEELLKYVNHFIVEGALRRDYDGMSAGTRVTARLSEPFLPKHYDIKGKANGLTLRFFAPGTEISIKPSRTH